MGSRPAPRAPDPIQTVRRQQGFDREAMTDAARFSNVNQSNPWGSRTFSGTPGTEDYMMTESLNPADQQRLDANRGIQSSLQGMITGGGMGGMGGGRAGKPGQPQAMPPMPVEPGAACPCWCW